MTALTPSFLASPMNLRKVDAFAPESGVDLFNKSHQAARTVILSGKQGWEVQPWPLRRLTPPQLTNKIKNGNETQAGWCWVFRLGFTREFSKDSFCLVISVSSLSHPDSVSPYVYIFIHLSIYCGSLMTVDLPKINKYMEETWVSSGLCLISTPHRLRVGITCWKWVKPNNLFPIPMSHSQPC